MAIPLFTMKAVHTAESEFVAQPIPIAAVILVARGAMPPRVRRRWILKSFGTRENLPWFARRECPPRHREPTQDNWFGKKKLRPPRDASRVAHSN